MLLTVSAAAALRQVTRGTIHRWIRLGLKARRLLPGNQWAIEKADLLAFLPRPVGNPNFWKKNLRRASLELTGPKKHRTL